jgi:hypothetical protein
MPEALQIPDALQMTFKRMLHRVPSKKRDDIEVQKSVLLFLKLGGERLARIRIKLMVSPFPESFSVVKLRPQTVLDEPVKKNEPDAVADEDLDDPDKE